MTFETIKTLIEKRPDAAEYQSLGYRANMLVGSAEDNANDTVYVDKSATADEWNRVALSSLELIVADERDADVRAIFDAAGFKY